MSIYYFLWISDIDSRFLSVLVKRQNKQQDGPSTSKDKGKSLSKYFKMSALCYITDVN